MFVIFLEKYNLLFEQNILSLNAYQEVWLSFNSARSREKSRTLILYNKSGKICVFGRKEQSWNNNLPQIEHLQNQ